MKRLAILAASFCISGATFALADDIPQLPENKAKVVACLDTLDVDGGTTWDQCMGLLFEPCAEHEVGGEDHLACLLADRDTWLTGLEREQARTAAMITAQGKNDLDQIMAQWRGYVRNKCANVGANNASTGADAAQAGCEMAELASVVGELTACSDQRSILPYCVLKK